MPLSTGIASIGLVAARLEEQKIHHSVTKFATPLALSLITAAPGAFANDAEMAADAVSLASGYSVGLKVTGDSTELQAMLKKTPDVDVVDTALVFNNPRNHKTLVAWVGYNANGRALGRAYTVVPANGVRFIRASDISNGRDYLGSASCKARARLIPASLYCGCGV